MGILIKNLNFCRTPFHLLNSNCLYLTESCNKNMVSSKPISALYKFFMRILTFCNTSRSGGVSVSNICKCKNDITHTISIYQSQCLTSAIYSSVSPLSFIASTMLSNRCDFSINLLFSDLLKVDRVIELYNAL